MLRKTLLCLASATTLAVSGLVACTENEDRVSRDAYNSSVQESQNLQTQLSESEKKYDELKAKFLEQSEANTTLRAEGEDLEGQNTDLRNKVLEEGTRIAEKGSRLVVLKQAFEKSLDGRNQPLTKLADLSARMKDLSRHVHHHTEYS